MRVKRTMIGPRLRLELIGENDKLKKVGRQGLDMEAVIIWRASKPMQNKHFPGICCT
jgi:hypothetical protein